MLTSIIFGTFMWRVGPPIEWGLLADDWWQTFEREDDFFVRGTFTTMPVNKLKELLPCGH